jgi:hypothetical protein
LVCFPYVLPKANVVDQNTLVICDNLLLDVVAVHSS